MYFLSGRNAEIMQKKKKKIKGVGAGMKAKHCMIQKGTCPESWYIYVFIYLFAYRIRFWVSWPQA